MITIEEVGALIRREARGKLDGAVLIDADVKLKDLGISSLQFAEIVFTLEEEHDVEFDPARAASAETLGDLIALGNEALSAKASD